MIYYFFSIYQMYQSGITLTDATVKLNSIKMMHARGYQLGAEEELLDKSSEKVLEYYKKENHFNPNNSFKIHYNTDSNFKIIDPADEYDEEYMTVGKYLGEYKDADQMGTRSRKTLSGLYKKDGDYCIVYFVSPSSTPHKEPSFGEVEYRNIMLVCSLYEITNLIIVSPFKATPSVAGKFHECFLEKHVTINVKQWMLQFFEYRELIFNLLDHEYVPKYALSSREECEDHYHSKEAPDKICMYNSDDPVVKYMGWRAGQYIKSISGDGLQGMVENIGMFIRITPKTMGKKNKGKLH